MFFIIVLGEKILASTVAVKEAFGAEGHNRAPIFILIVSGVLIVFSLWWTYFAHEASDVLARVQGASNLEPYVWGFGTTSSSRRRPRSAPGSSTGSTRRGCPVWSPAAGITVPVSVLVAAMWVVHLRQHESRLHGVLMGAASVAVLASTFTQLPELAAGLLLVAMVAVKVWLNQYSPKPALMRCWPVRLGAPRPVRSGRLPRCRNAGHRRSLPNRTRACAGNPQLENVVSMAPNVSGR